MVFWLQIQADHGSEMLQNIHPDSKRTSGKAVLAFLMGLHRYSRRTEPDRDNDPLLKSTMIWYQKLETLANISFLPACRALIDSDWSDIGDPIEYREDEYEFFKRRTAGYFTEEQFLSMVRDYDKHWQPIDKVMQGVRLLLDIFNKVDIEPLDGFYVPEDSIPEFEALYYTLELLKKRGCQSIRLNFY